MQTNQQTKEAGLKALAIVGFVAVLVFGVWGFIQILRMVPNVFSSLSAAAVSLTSVFVPAERLEITSTSLNVNSGEPFTLSWNHTGARGTGSYTVTYSCRDGVSMETPDTHGVYQKVFCDVPFNLTNDQTSIKLIPISQAQRYIDVPLKLTFTRLSDGQVTASTDTALTITNEQLTSGSTTTPVVVTPSTPVVTTPSTPAPTTPVRKPGTPSRSTYTITTAGRASDPNGRPDLSVTIIQTGTIDSATNVFVPVGSIKQGGKGAVRFSVENLGTKTIESWNFNAVLPTYPMYIFSSNMQPALGPGDKIEYTLGFDMADANATNGILTVNADPANRIWNEVTKNNNIARSSFTIVQ